MSRSSQWHDDVDLYVFEGVTDIAEQAARALAGYDVEVIRADMLTSFNVSEGRRVIALVSSTAIESPESSLHSLIGGQAVPVIWVAGEQASPSRTHFSPEYRNILPARFSGAALRSQLFKLLGELEAEREGGKRTDRLVAESPCMNHFLQEVAAYADCSATVLIHGETGVGKERIAMMLHALNQHYGKGPFVAVNCGAIPDGLFESHFFGHAKGAFTGASLSHKGYFEQAHGGTLFLDEIGDLPLFQQVKLLRVLEQSTVTRLGSTVEIPLDFRVVAATHRSLKEQVKRGDFRADLYYRLAVVELLVPNLEARGPEDKEALFQYVLDNILEQERTPVPDWVRNLVRQSVYAGNVRELRNIAERVAIQVRQFKSWDPARIQPIFRQLNDAAGGVELAPEAQAERQRIVDALQANQWRRQDTAAQLGISRKVLWEKMRKLQIDEDDLDAVSTEDISS